MHPNIAWLLLFLQDKVHVIQFSLFLMYFRVKNELISKKGKTIIKKINFILVKNYLNKIDLQ